MGKRAAGEGTIVQRKGKDGKPGLWMAVITLPNGKRKPFYAKTKAEANEKKTAALADLQKGIMPTKGKQTVAQFLTEWLDTTVAPNAAPATTVSYRSIVKHHIIPAIGRHKLDKLTPQQVQAMQAGMLKAGKSPRTVAYARTVLRRALGQAVRWNLAARNVAALVDPPKQERHDAEFLTMDDARALTAALAGDSLEPLIVLDMVTGLRRGEILSLRWQDVNLDKGKIAIAGQYQKWDGAWQWRPLKTAASRRAIGIPPFVVQLLRTQRARQNEMRLAAGPDWQDFGLVFTTGTGTPMDGSSLTHQFQKRLTRAGIRRVPFHALRHSAATMLLSRGLTLGQIQKILGHSQIALTANLYGHHTDEIAEQAAREMEDIFKTG